MKNLYESKWDATRKLLCEGADLQRNQDGSLNPSKQKVMETVLDNTYRHLMEQASSGATSSANV